MDKFYRHSITTRIKTSTQDLNRQRLTYSIVIPLQQGLRLRLRVLVYRATYSIVIPLQQGLRLRGLLLRLLRRLFYRHSITTRIKTSNGD